MKYTCFIWTPWSALTYPLCTQRVGPCSRRWRWKSQCAWELRLIHSIWKMHSAASAGCRGTSMSGEKQWAALISKDGHKHSSLLLKKINPSLFTNHLIFQKTIGTESICFLNWRQSLTDKQSKCMNRMSACQLRKVNYTIALSVDVHFLKQRVNSPQLSMFIRVGINGHGLSSDTLQQIVF